MKNKLSIFKDSRLWLCILLIITVVFLIRISCNYKELDTYCTYLEGESVMFQTENSELKSAIKEQSDKIIKYEDLVSKKDKTIKELNKKVKSLESKLSDLKKKSASTSVSTSYKSSNDDSEGNSGDPIANDTGFRSWMPYTAITATNSIEYKVSRMATPNNYGIMCINGNPLVAIGTGWSIDTGSVISVKTTSCTFSAVVSDHKSPSCTDSANKVGFNGCACEFLVDTSCLSSTIRNSGNVASIGSFGGKIISITKTGSVL